MSASEVFQRISSALDQAGIGYMLSGSFASAHYGAPRSTQDIDLVIEATPAQLRQFIEELPSSQYYADLDAALEAYKRQSMFNVIDRSRVFACGFRRRRPYRSVLSPIAKGRDFFGARDRERHGG
jgi:dienelactone hydrolase